MCIINTYFSWKTISRLHKEMSNSFCQSFRIIRRHEKHSINKITYFYRLHSVITQQERNSFIDIIAILHVFLFLRITKGTNRASKSFKEIILNGEKFWKHIISVCDTHSLLRIFLRWGAQTLVCWSILAHHLFLYFPELWMLFIFLSD